MDIKEAYKFCPRCNGGFEKKPGYLHCADCGLDFYINPKPTSSILLVNQDGKYLFGKRAHEPSKGLWDTFGGFVDSNETLEEATVRETKEETGLDIEAKDLKYVGSFNSGYDYQGINYETLNSVFIAKMPPGAKIKPDDDMNDHEFLTIDEIRTKPLAFDWIVELVKVLATTDNK